MFDLNVVTSLPVFHMRSTVRSGSDGERIRCTRISPVPRCSVKPGIYQLKYL